MAKDRPLSRSLQFFFKIYRREIRFLFLFITIFLFTNFIYFLCDGTFLQTFILSVMTAKPSAAIIKLMTPEEDLAVKGGLIFTRYGFFSVVKGCEGAQGFFILFSAILAFGIKSKDKFMGILFGGIFIYLLNLTRIVGLYYILKYNADFFVLAHGYVGQTFSIIMGIIFFLFWINRSSLKNE